MSAASGTQWRLLIETAPEAVSSTILNTEYGREGEAAWNMAVDEALLDSVSANAAPPTLRLYKWRSSALTLGRFQNVERTLHPEACSMRDVPLVRRITGGRGILHGDDLTIGLAAPIAALGLNPGSATGTLALYEQIATGYLEAFRQLGIDAASGACERVRDVRGDCFATVSRADIVERATGRKLLGAALHRREGWILQQASLPLGTPDLRAQVKEIGEALFQGPSPISVAGAGLSWETLCEALLSGLASALNAEFVMEDLTSQEQSRAADLMRTRYACPEWNVPSK